MIIMIFKSGPAFVSASTCYIYIVIFMILQQPVSLKYFWERWNKEGSANLKEDLRSWRCAFMCSINLIPPAKRMIEKESNNKSLFCCPQNSLTIFIKPHLPSLLVMKSATKINKLWNFQECHLKEALCFKNLKPWLSHSPAWILKNLPYCQKKNSL